MVIYWHIREQRIQNGFTQKYVAEFLHMSQTGYSKYETGENDIPTLVLIGLSELYAVSVDYLLDLTDSQALLPSK